MLNYAICEIGASQYKLIPGKVLLVTQSFDSDKTFEVPALILAEDGKIKIGKPYLKDKIKIRCLDVLKGKKIRVAKFHAKANYRRVRGHRANLSRIVLAS